MDSENNSYPDQSQLDQIQEDGSNQQELENQENEMNSNQQYEEYYEEEEDDNNNKDRRRIERESNGGHEGVGNGSEDTTTNDESGGRPDSTSCCKNCTKDGKLRRRACVCQVPSSQRRARLGPDGCITCHCTGCHPEDLKLKKKKEEEDDNHLKNGCCRACMKAFSENKKACLCQVPSDVRMAVLPPDGCRICKCKGCHPDEANIRRRARQHPSLPQPQRSVLRPEPFVFEGYNPRDYYRYGANPATFPSATSHPHVLMPPSSLPPPTPSAFASPPPSLSRHHHHPSSASSSPVSSSAGLSSSAHHRSTHHIVPPAPIVIHHHPPSHPLGAQAGSAGMAPSSFSSHGISHRGALGNPISIGTPLTNISGSASLRGDRSLLPSPGQSMATVPLSFGHGHGHPHSLPHPSAHHSLAPHHVVGSSQIPGVPSTSSAATSASQSGLSFASPGYPYPTHFDAYEQYYRSEAYLRDLAYDHRIPPDYRDPNKSLRTRDDRNRNSTRSTSNVTPVIVTSAGGKRERSDKAYHDYSDPNRKRERLHN